MKSNNLEFKSVWKEGTLKTLMSSEAFPDVAATLLLMIGIFIHFEVRKFQERMILRRVRLKVMHHFLGPMLMDTLRKLPTKEQLELGVRVFQIKRWRRKAASNVLPDIDPPTSHISPATS